MKKYSLPMVITLFATLLVPVPSQAAGLTVVFPSQNVGFRQGVWESVATKSGVTPSISGSTASSIRATVSAGTNGLLRLGVIGTGVTAAAGYDITQFDDDGQGLATISFQGPEAGVSASLASLQFQRTTNTGDNTITVEVSDGVGLIYGNSYYETYTEEQSISWEVAFQKAAARRVASSVAGQFCQGYLATITSAGEQTFVYSKVNVASWLGGADAYQYIDPYVAGTYTQQSDTEGKWYWVTGPERGTQFSNGSVAVGANYTNWNGSEPNNSGSNEHALQFTTTGSGGWNDLPFSGNVKTYVVEYGGVRSTSSFTSDYTQVSYDNLAELGDVATCVPATVGSSRTASFTAQSYAVPGAPTNQAATAGAQSASLSWSAPASNGGIAITGYMIEASRDGGSYSSVTANTGSTATTATVSNLLVGSTYTFKISAINLVGTSNASAATTGVVVFANLPSAPSGIAVSYPGNSAPISISWDAPSNNGGSAITSYVVEYQNGGSWIPLTASGQTSSISSSLVTINNRWGLRVAAVNIAGQGPWATWENEPPAPYSGPVFTGIGTGGNISAGKNSSITLTGSNLSMVSELFVGTTKLTFTRNGDQLVANLPALTAGTYDLRVVFTGGGVLIHQSALRVTEQVARVNVGSVNGRVVLFVANRAGSNISWRVGGKWGKAVADSDFVRIDRPTPRRGASVKVELYVDGKLELTRTVVTR